MYPRHPDELRSLAAGHYDRAVRLGLLAHSLEVIGEDDWEDGAILVYDRPGRLAVGLGWESRLLTYVAIKAGGSWWTSAGRHAGRPQTWDTIRAELAESESVWFAPTLERVYD